MEQFDSKLALSRRRMLGVGGGMAGALVAGTALATSARGTAAPLVHPPGAGAPAESIVKQIQDIIQAQGMVSNGVLSIEIDRDDITNVQIHGVPILPAFEVNGGLFFEDIGNGRTAMNSDMALKASEIDPFIDQLLAHNIVFQAEHQHFYDFEPSIWFIHFRAAGDPIALAYAVKAALNVTSTPFPQTLPQNPKTPLPYQELGQILGGMPTVGANGVVTINVPREDPIVLGGRRINPFLNVATNFSFEPYGGGQNAAAAPDFGMTAGEVQSVIRTMRNQGWDIGCLYNQETDEYPQLFFSHQFKTGDSIQLAHELRNGANHMDLKFMS